MEKGSTGTSTSSVKENVKSCTWGGIIPYIRKDWDLIGWRAALQRVLVGSKLNMSQKYVLVARKASSILEDHHQQAQVILPLNTGETHLECWIKCLAPQYERDHGHGL